MSTKTSDDVLLHYGRKGQKWYHHIFSSVRSGTGRRRKANQQNTPHSHKTSKRKKRGPVDELQREREIIELYRNRDKVSTKVLKNKIARIESERKLKELAEAPGKARAEALQKKRQARLKFVGKVISSGIDVYSKIPSSVATRKIDKNNKDAIDKAIKDFKLRQEWAKAFKDVPITMTNFTQSVNIRGVDVYIPETIQNRFMIQHSGRKGMKWGYHIFGDPNRRAFNKAVRGTRSIVRKKGMAGADHLAESESIESLMTKRGPYKLNYSSSKLLDGAVTTDYRTRRFDPNVTKSVVSTINSHDFTNFKVSDNKGSTTVVGDIKKYIKPYVETTVGGTEIKYGMLATRRSKNFMNHSVTGGTLNGVYIPSNEEVLLQYGKKGMKWKKRKGLPVAGAVRDAMDEAEYRSNIADNNERTNSIQRDIGTIKNKMAQSLGAIKSEVRNGKTKNPKEQRYLDKYRSLVKEYNEAYKRLDEARGSRKRVEEKRSTQKKYKK